jgi:hypothetical protein
MVEEYSMKLLLLGGHHVGATPGYFRMPPDRLVRLAQLNTVTAGVIQKAIAQLDTTRTWREMSWQERWRWLPDYDVPAHGVMVGPASDTQGGMATGMGGVITIAPQFSPGPRLAPMMPTLTPPTTSNFD